MNNNRVAVSYIRWFTLPVAIFLLSAVPLSLYFGAITGDLTRIGNWSERDFGWNKPQADVFIHSNGLSVTNPEVLILGDSYSHPNIWQSYLEQGRQLQTLSYQYQDVGCIDNWVDWALEKHHPDVHTVVIQIAERSFVPQFRMVSSCPRRKPDPVKIPQGDHNANREDFDITLDGSYLLPAIANSIRIAGGSSERIVSGEVISVPLSTSRLFSNLKSDRMLYYADDELKANWSAEDVRAAATNLKSIQDAISEEDLRFILIVIPDKSSVYRDFFADQDDYLEYPDVHQSLRDAGVNAVDLLTFFQQQAAGTVDLYLPNDTHLSAQGFELLASKIADDFF
jgi:hypothetical protein